MKRKHILTDEQKLKFYEWFGPNIKDWAGKQVKFYVKLVRDENGKVIGDTIDVCLPDETPTDMKPQ